MFWLTHSADLGCEKGLGDVGSFQGPGCGVHGARVYTMLPAGAEWNEGGAKRQVAFLLLVMDIIEEERTTLQRIRHRSALLASHGNLNF